MLFVNGLNYAYVHHNVHCSTIYSSQDMEATSVHVDRGTDKEDVCVCVCVYTHTYIYMNIGRKK